MRSWTLWQWERRRSTIYTSVTQAPATAVDDKPGSASPAAATRCDPCLGPLRCPVIKRMDHCDATPHAFPLEITPAVSACLAMMTEALLTKWYQRTPNIWQWQFSYISNRQYIILELKHVYVCVNFSSRYGIYWGRLDYVVGIQLFPHFTALCVCKCIMCTCWQTFLNKHVPSCWLQNVCIKLQAVTRYFVNCSSLCWHFHCTYNVCGIQ